MGTAVSGLDAYVEREGPGASGEVDHGDGAVKRGGRTDTWSARSRFGEVVSAQLHKSNRPR